MRAKFSEQYKFKLLKNNNSSLYKYSSIVRIEINKSILPIYKTYFLNIL